MTERVELELVKLHETPDALLLARAGDERNGKWVPKQFATRIADGKFSIERWAAQEKGLLTPVDNVRQGSLF